MIEHRVENTKHMLKTSVKIGYHQPTNKHAYSVLVSDCYCDVIKLTVT